MMNTIERYKARWVVHGFMEILDEHFSPDSTHAPVASDSSLLVMMSLVAIRVLKIKQMDAKSAFLNSPLIHDVWVRFPDGYVHSLGHSFTKLCKSLYGPKQAAADWYELQHHRLMALDPALERSHSTFCLHYRVKDGHSFFVLVYVDGYAVAYSDQQYFDECLAHLCGTPETDDFLDIKHVEDVTHLVQMRITC
mmetsp:Transcript_36402/g.69861  ORF Transcript_36402/g.69861 Transcript_36402/m.69861 type:complete len:194 (-) Transcript_36402:909-1490(-)|eukprot:CAMPEP_0114258786 /NCGR_PEP_ID=MMETSP0058-20121206/19525_1 /TAXON_ID=36894 /ORGANISM="Pyramimonas parkeae, CCMP726" /LENGTH=193 /DNA_ID=CAMNT_0001373749 /DNA_START=705 /DNA_END=1286 /DNA_ORIENTATION=+